MPWAARRGRRAWSSAGSPCMPGSHRSSARPCRRSFSPRPRLSRSRPPRSRSNWSCRARCRRRSTVSPSKVVKDAVTTSLSGTGNSPAGLTSSRSRVSSAVGGPADRGLALEFRVGRRVLDGEIRIGRRAADDELAAVRLGQGDLGDLLLGDVDDLPVEPARRIAGRIERAAREPGLRFPRFAQIDPVIAGAEPIVAPFADDRLGQICRPICP